MQPWPSGAWRKKPGEESLAMKPLFEGAVLALLLAVGFAALVAPPRRRRRREEPVRVLVAYEKAYRVYQDALARAIKDHRPHFAVLGADPRGLDASLESFEPHAVVCGRPSSEYPGRGRGAWVELPADPDEAGEICVGGDREGAANPGLGEVLGALDEVDERLRRGDLAETC